MTAGSGALLCDIDGVVRHWDSHSSLEQAFGVATGTIAAAAFAPARLNPAITGQCTDEQWRAAVASDLAEVCGSVQRAQAMIAEWSAVEPRVDGEVVELLSRARESVPVVLVSNATTRLEVDLSRQGLGGVADAVVNTARIGVAKPDPRVYRIAAERVGVEVERCLFVDDSADNVAAARALGMTALHYQSPAQLRETLNSWCPM